MMIRMTAELRPPPGRLAIVIGVALPLSILALAFALATISDRLVHIGPFDRAMFGWLFVVPLLALAPVGAGLSWKRLTAGGTLLAAAALGAILAAVSATLLWVSIAHPDCEFGARFTPAEMVPPSLAIGVVFGGTLMIAGLIVTLLARRGHPWWGVILGAAAGVGVLFASILAFVVVMPMAGVCNRPI